jgi:dihydrofolate reductase
MSNSRRIVAHMFVSLDGVVESPDKWHFPYFNDEMGEAVSAGFVSSDTLLMGGTVYREWAQYWPNSTDEPIAGIMNNIPKYVVSNTLTSADWQNTTLITGDDIAGQIRALKAQDGKDIAMSGSATLVNWLLAEGLLDELQMLVHPIVVGSGKRLFDTATATRPLELTSSRTYSNGVLELSYRPATATP